MSTLNQLGTGSGESPGYVPLDAKTGPRLRAALSDLAVGLRRHASWRFLSAEQVRNSYRRTVLGPWWLTAQTLLYVLGLALVFGQLLGAELREFLPYVATGFLTFSLLSNLVRGAANVFVAQASMIKSARQPLSNLVFRMVCVELIQFLHNAVILLGFCLFGLISLSPWLLVAPGALVLIAANGVALALWLGPLVARFRDVTPAVESVLQVAIFFTPVFYRPDNLSGVQAGLVGWNPFTYFIDLFRDGALGHPVALSTVVGAAAWSAANVLLGVLVFSRTRSRIPYWVG